MSTMVVGEGETSHLLGFDKLGDNGPDTNLNDQPGYKRVYNEVGNEGGHHHRGDIYLENNCDDTSAISISCREESQQNQLFGEIPTFGWTVKMDHVFKETWQQIVRPKLRQIPELICFFVRYVIWWIGLTLIQRRKPIIDMIMLNGKQIYGVPLGGIGSGTIGRGFKGQFCRFQMTPGLYTYDVVHQNQFIISIRDSQGTLTYQKVLSAAGPPPKSLLSTWDWTFNPENGSYLGLYPRAWYTYNIPEENLVVKCKQISPVIPHNYKDSCIPASCFIWSIENQSQSKKRVSITFTFKNGTGSCDDKRYKCSTVSFDTIPVNVHNTKNGQLHGVAIQHVIQGIDTTYGIGCLERPGVSVTHMASFDVKHGTDIWEKLTTRSCLDKESSSYEIRKGEVGSAVNGCGVVGPNSSLEMVFSLVWDQPIIKFKGKQHAHTRRYTRFISRESQPASKEQVSDSVIAVQNLLKYSLENVASWDALISKWQAPILSDAKLPEWFKSALFNELYFVSDGGTIWLEDERVPFSSQDSPSFNNLRKEFGRFGYLEAQEYRMYNTYDVHFYASFALIELWPKLQQSIQYDFADTIPFEDSRIRTFLFTGKRGYRKVKDSVPHDLGDPWEDPYFNINGYNMHDVSEWKDLNLKFVLLVYRDYKTMNCDAQYLNDMLPFCSTVMKKSMAWDKDGDGLIENSGEADQTYDSWIMTGPSAYCGGLWLASLAAMIEMLKVADMDPLEKQNDIELYENILSKGTKTFNTKMWVGDYYKFDCSAGSQSQAIMSDQLCGHWLLAMSELDDTHIFPKANVLRALNTIYDKNVLGVRSGQMGAVNGARPEGTIDLYSIQSEETWTGVTYSLAATMIANGMVEQGFKTAEGIYRTVYELIGQGYETPEALHHLKRYRALGYCRPLSIWSIWRAWNLLENGTGTK